jgi:hypothetical protein
MFASRPPAYPSPPHTPHAPNTQQNHERVMRSLNMVSQRPRHVGNDYYHSKDRPEEITVEDLEEEAVLLAVQVQEKK